MKESKIPENTLVVEGSKKEKQKIKEWYNRKYVETGKNKEVLGNIDKAVDVHVKLVKYAGYTATAILALCPLDGPFGEILGLLATPLLSKAVKFQDEIYAKGVKKTFEKVDGILTKDFKAEEKISLPAGVNVEDVKEIKLNEKEKKFAFGGKNAA